MPRLYYESTNFVIFYKQSNSSWKKKTVRSFLSCSASNLTSVAYRQGNYVELVSVMASLLPFAEDDKNGTAMVKYSNFDLCTRHMIVWGLLVAI